MISGYHRLFMLSICLAVATTIPAHSQSLPDLVERSRPSIAFILSRRAQGIASGTGFVVHPDGFILTAHHVVDSAREIIVVLPGRQPSRGNIVASNAKLDIALLRIPVSGLSPLRLGNSLTARVGEDVFAIGYPLADILGNYEVTVTRGIISAIRSQEGLLQVDAAINPGVSGGPISNGRGEVIGVAVLVLRGAQSVSFAVPINLVRPLLTSRITTVAPPVAPPSTVPIAPVQPPRATSGSLIVFERTASTTFGQLVFRLEADKASYGPAELVEIVLAIENPGPTDMFFTFLTSQFYDFVILHGTVEIARWSLGRSFQQFDGPRTLTLAAGAKFEYRTRWRQLDQNDDPVRPGRYTVIGYYLSWPNPVSLSLLTEKLP